MPFRTVALIGAVCLTVGWLLASTLAPPVARLQSLPQRQSRPTPAPEDPTFTEQLHFRLQHPPTAPAPRRNPFVFGDRRRSAAAVARGEAAANDAPAVETQSAGPVGPAFALAGIGITGDTRTAILSEGQDVHIVKIGDRVGGYDILEITDSSVTLGEPSGLRYLLRLR